MAISFVNIGTTSATADTATPFAATSYQLPAAVAAGDLLIVSIGDKPFGTIPVEPAAFAEQVTITNGSVAAVADGGSVRAGVFTRTMVAGDAAPSFTWPAQYNPQHGSILGLRKTNAGSWTLESTTGIDSNTATTAFSAAGAGTLAYVAGDWAVVVVIVPTDAGAHAAPSLTIPGCTVGALTQWVPVPGTNAGFDLARYVYTAEITAGTASGVPTFAATGTSGATGSAQGSVVFLRVAEPAGGTGAMVTPGTVLGDISVPTPNVITSSAEAFAARSSTLRGAASLRFGSSSDVWATILPDTVLGTTVVPRRPLWEPITSLTVTAVVAGRLDLAWTAVTTAVGYEVERDGAVIATDLTATTYQDTGLGSNMTHDYRVRAFR